MQQNSHQTGDDEGPWRDGWYVVASANSHMPHRCMVCGENIERLDATPVPLPRMARGIVSGAHWLLAGERFKVQHGRCDRHRVPWSKYFGVAAGIVSIASMLTFVGSMLAANGRFGTAQGLLLGVFVVSMV